MKELPFTHLYQQCASLLFKNNSIQIKSFNFRSSTSCFSIAKFLERVQKLEHRKLRKWLKKYVMNRYMSQMRRQLRRRWQQRQCQRRWWWHSTECFYQGVIIDSYKKSQQKENKRYNDLTYNYYKILTNVALHIYIYIYIYSAYVKHVIHLGGATEI